MLCQHDQDVLCPPEALEDWGLITSSNLLKTMDSKNVSIDGIREVLLDPHGHKGYSVVKGKMGWSWGIFKMGKGS